MRANTVMIWQGESVIDGSPIAVFLSGLSRKSKNPKTGNMVQAWILRTDISPVEAIVTARDFAICGDCKHRGYIDANGILRGRSCYVSVKNAPLAVYRAWKRGVIPAASVASISPALVGRKVRFGAYGDPAAVPVSVWRDLAAVCAGHTGYTHQWRNAGLQGLCMASADTPDEQAAARLMGYRVFRVKLEAEPLTAGEISCPASEEAGKRTSCESCGLCNGSKGAHDARKSIAINAHGIGTSSFIRLREVR
jgi:hypothetical protein